jgi:hypothetical protein
MSNQVRSPFGRSNQNLTPRTVVLQGSQEQEATNADNLQRIADNTLGKIIQFFVGAINNPPQGAANAPGGSQLVYVLPDGGIWQLVQLSFYCDNEAETGVAQLELWVQGKKGNWPDGDTNNDKTALTDGPFHACWRSKETANAHTYRHDYFGNADRTEANGMHILSGAPDLFAPGGSTVSVKKYLPMGVTAATNFMDLLWTWKRVA